MQKNRKNKAIFLDRDGVLNKERGTYTFRIEDFYIEKGVIEALEKFKKIGYLLIVVTNQGGIAKGLYNKSDVKKCFQYLQKESNYLIDAHYYSPYHDLFSDSLSRKPDSLMIEKATAKFNIELQSSWIIGDSERDILAGEKKGLRGVLITKQAKKKSSAMLKANSLIEACHKLLYPYP